MLNIHFREENSFVLPKPYFVEVYIEHAHQLITKETIHVSVIHRHVILELDGVKRLSEDPIIVTGHFVSDKSG